MLSNEQLLDYIRKAKDGDENAKSEIFIRNEPLIKSIIRRFKGKGVEYDDLYQIACIGFLKAIKNFDESFGVKFSTYSVPMIIGEIKRYMRDNGAVKVSRTLKMLANKINRYVESYQTLNDRSPNIEEIAESFGISAEEAVVALDSARMPVSLYEKFDDEDETRELIDKLPSEDKEDDILTKIQLSSIIDGLTERERKIVMLRFFRDKTQTETAESLGLSQVQISRLENKILEKIRLKF